MACFDDYIGINSSYTSRSGLYVSDLPGMTTDLLDSIARSTSDDRDDIFPVIYKRARKNLVSDVGKRLTSKFYKDLKLVTRETSKFGTDNNTNTSLAGVKLEIDLPKYARIHVISVEVNAPSTIASLPILFYEEDDDGNRTLLQTTTKAITSTGKTTINVDTDFEVDKLFIAYNPATYTLKETENKYYPGCTSFSEVICDYCYWEGYNAVVTQVNDGGLNVKFVIYCSDEKVVCENINLFAVAFWYKIGWEICVERRLTERLNQYVIMTQERWEELMKYYNDEYEKAVSDVLDNLKLPEDGICFACKNSVRTDTFLP